MVALVLFVFVVVLFLILMSQWGAKTDNIPGQRKADDEHGKEEKK